MHAWEEWGEECFSRFNGQWALALWDRRAAAARALARPPRRAPAVLHARSAHGLLFASEVKAIFADPSVDRAFDPAGLDQTFTYWSTGRAPHGVPRHRAARARALRGPRPRRASGRLPTGASRSPSGGASRVQDTRENADELRERLVEATRLRFLRSDVPVGAYLSGGLDSSITAAVIARYTDVPLHTFSLRFADERVRRRATTRSRCRQSLGTAAPGHRRQPVRHRRRSSREVIRHTETPIVRAAPAPLFLLSKLVSRERLQGRRDRARAPTRCSPGTTSSARPGCGCSGRATRNRRSASRAAELLYPWMARSPGQSTGLRPQLLRPQSRSRRSGALAPAAVGFDIGAIKSMLSARHAGRRSADADADDVVAAMPPDSEDWDPLSRAQWLEMTTLLAGYILSSQGDRMLMANSVEGRFPFLDRDVVDFANQLPARHKLFGLEEKYLLKRAFADLVPDEILHRPKQPYRAPDAASFFAGGRPEWFDEVTSRSGHSRRPACSSPRLVSGLFAKCAQIWRREDEQHRQHAGSGGRLHAAHV